MFWSRFNLLCEAKGKKTNPVGKEIGVVSSTINKWKNGAVPNGEILLKIADYFDVSVDYLLGKTDIPTPMKKNTSPSNKDELIKEMLENVPELQKFMDEFVTLPLQEQEEILKYVTFRKSQLLADEE